MITPLICWSPAFPPPDMNYLLNEWEKYDTGVMPESHGFVLQVLVPGTDSFLSGCFPAASATTECKYPLAMIFSCLPHNFHDSKHPWLWYLRSKSKFYLSWQFFFFPLRGCSFICFLLFFETSSQKIAQPGLELTKIYLSLLFECYN